jgi:hypothetical protein
MCGVQSNKEKAMCDCKSCGCSNESGKHPMMVRLFETLERMEEKLDNIEQELESIGAALFEEIEEDDEHHHD